MRRASDNTKPNVVWWTILLLVALGSVLIALFFAGRVVLSPEHERALDAFQRAAPSPPTVREYSPAPARQRSPPGVVARPATAPVTAPPAESNELEAPRELSLQQLLWSTPRLRAYLVALSDTVHPPSLEGILRVPAVGIEVPVYSGTDAQSLDRGAGRIEWTPPLGAAGNVGIAAHRDGFFRPLKDIAKGDRLTIELPNETLVYEVDDIRVVDPESVGVLAPSAQPSLTLITCFPFYYVGAAPKRFIVHAALVR